MHEKDNVPVGSVAGMIDPSPAQTKVASGKGCSVVVFNHQWLPKSYDADTRPMLSKNVTGLLSLYETGDITKNGFLQRPIEFKVGILKKTASDDDLLFGGYLSGS